MKVPFIPDDAPFSKDQKQWLSGFFAGLHTRVLAQDKTTSTRPAVSLSILYGSQTGNAESLAYDIETAAKDQGLAARVLSMDTVEPADLAGIENLLLVTSTYGEGDMPDNAEILWQAMQADSAPELTQMRYSVLALGDTAYDEFCKAGIDWDQRLAALGAECVAERVDCDVDFEQAAEEWIARVVPLFADGVATAATAEPEDTKSLTGSTEKERVKKSQYTSKNPFWAPLLTNRLLTGPDSSKETRHYELSLKGSDIEYKPGDALCVIPDNGPQLVDELLATLQFEGSETVTIKGSELVLRDALLSVLEIKSPSKELIAAVAERSADATLGDLLAAGDKAALADYLWGRDTLDLLLQFPGLNFKPDEFVGFLKPLQHRAYSISSSPAKHSGEVHLTVASVRYDSYGRAHKGVCSTFLADLVSEGESVKCFLMPNHHFKVPDDNRVPMIMVGPGTGIAPFRAFLEERAARQATGENWLFFGDRNAATDFIYRDELEQMQASGCLSRLDLAFSRDQAEKIYVQDRMLEHGSELFTWLKAGAYFFVCGDAYRMAKDVDQALHSIIAEYGALSAEEAVDYVNQMKKDKRYVRDVY